MLIDSNLQTMSRHSHAVNSHGGYVRSCCN